MAFPASILSLADAIGSQFLSVFFGGSVSHSSGINSMKADLVAVETKLGTGASTPTNKTVLAGNGTGTTAFTASPTLSGTVVAEAGVALGAGLTAAAGQLAFPATQNPSTGANVLDDYEEGIWNPSLGGTATYFDARGFYVKVGRVVHVWCILVVNAIGTGSTTVISGLPFAADQLASACVSRVTSAAANAVCWTAYVNTSTLNVDAKNATNGAASSDALAVFGSGTGIEIQATYRTAN